MVEDGDIIAIDIAARSIQVELSEQKLAERRSKEETRGGDAFTPVGRDRIVSEALKAYALLATSADLGAVRRLPG